MALATQMSKQPKSSFASKEAEVFNRPMGNVLKWKGSRGAHGFLLGIFMCIDMPGWEST